MTDYLTVIEVLAINHDQIEHYGGPPEFGTAVCWRQLFFGRRPATTPI